MLKSLIQADIKEAMKQKNQDVLGVLRMVMAAVNAKEQEGFYKLGKEAVLTDEEMIGVISGEIKKRRDAIALFEQGGRPELAEGEKKEIAMLQKYLPEQLSVDELKSFIEAAIKNTGASSMKEMGKIMAELAPKTKGRAENSEISKIVKELLS